MKAKFTILLTALCGVVFLVSAQSSSSLSDMALLGKSIFFDKISSPDWMTCATCHAESVGFTGPIPGINKFGSVYRGAVPKRFGNRKPPSIAYATFSPVFHYDSLEGLFIGGNFWDGRATGEHLGNPAADQALGPFLNPVEQNNPGKKAVLEQIEKSKYAWLWDVVWGEPISYATQADIDVNYDRVGLAISAYEASPEVNAFSSKFDFYLDGLVNLTQQELLGMQLFNGKASCNACHVSDVGPAGEHPLFTDFSFDNLGVPKNPHNPFYDMDNVYLDNGDPINPLGSAWIDKGLGGFLETRPEYAALADSNIGKHKVPTLRNVGKKTGNGFPKAFMHNGVFKSLKEVVHFYNTRDVEAWPPPEVAANVNSDELGDLMLTDEEENAIVAFMRTLSDGYELPGMRKSADVVEGMPDGIALQVQGPDMGTNQFRLAYVVPSDGFVELAVFTITGERVRTLVSAEMAEGAYAIDFQPEWNFSSGIYLVRLTANGQELVRKLMIAN